jgi:type VI secretion system Hcp family effector
MLGRPLTYIALFGLWLTPVIGADIFIQAMRADGRVVGGNSTHAQYPQWIAATHVAGAVTRTSSGQASLEQIVITKNADAATVAFFEMMTTSERLLSVSIEFVKNTPLVEPYYALVLKNVFVTSLKQSATAETSASPCETITLSFASMEIVHGSRSMPQSIVSRYFDSEAQLGGATPTPYVYQRGSWVDYDQDGLPDDWEKESGGLYNPVIPDGLTDVDGDGLTGGQEFLVGTNPGLSDRFVQSTLFSLPENHCVISFRTVTGRLYEIQSSSDLTDWHTVDSFRATANEMQSTTRPALGTFLFHRVKVSP